MSDNEAQDDEAPLMNDPDPALLELLAAAGFDLAPRGNDWIATHRSTGQQVEGATPIEAAKRALAAARAAERPRKRPNKRLIPPEGGQELIACPGCKGMIDISGRYGFVVQCPHCSRSWRLVRRGWWTEMRPAEQ